MKSFDPMPRPAAAFIREGLNRPWPHMNARVLSLGLGAALLSGLGALLLAKARHQPAESCGSSTSAPSALVSGNDPCAPALVSHQGNDKVDLEIQRLQAAARSVPKRSDLMTRLGWAFITKARLSCDPGYYKLAEQCALCVQATNAENPDALLLQGHIWQSLHKFKEAEPLARKLITMRADAFDYGLLGDVLMEQGHLSEAVVAYQKMIDLKPNLQSYTRVAHARWLKGDIEGAIEAMRMAITAGSPREPEPTAWAYTRFGIYEFQAGDFMTAARSADLALQFAQDYAAALLLRGRILLSQGKPTEAIEPLQRAATVNPLPEYQWILADALQEAGRSEAAAEVESRLMRTGALNDPRTFALYLATMGQQVQQALKLAQEELNTRADVFTMDALAWALKANGRFAEAQDYSKKSLSEGTQDARLYYHAGCIAMANGDYAYAQRSFTSAAGIKQMLMPSERNDLTKQISALKGLETPSSFMRSN
jgi:tetratricopeptide (TPR) repeat protein